MRYLTSKGDTIVEVLVAILVLSVVLTGAYISANHSLNSSRQSQERNEAIKVAETQIEQIKSYASDPSKNVYTTTPYCFNALGNNTPFGGYDPFAQPLNSDVFASYPTGPNGCNFQNFYYVAIKWQGASPNDFFTIQVRWDRVGGQRDEIKMTYRLHQ